MARNVIQKLLIQQAILAAMMIFIGGILGGAGQYLYMVYFDEELTAPEKMVGGDAAMLLFFQNQNALYIDAIRSGYNLVVYLMWVCFGVGLWQMILVWRIYRKAGELISSQEGKPESGQAATLDRTHNLAGGEEYMRDKHGC